MPVRARIYPLHCSDRAIGHQLIHPDAQFGSPALGCVERTNEGFSRGENSVTRVTFQVLKDRRREFVSEDYILRLVAPIERFFCQMSDQRG